MAMTNNMDYGYDKDKDDQEERRLRAGYKPRGQDCNIDLLHELPELIRACRTIANRSKGKKRANFERVIQKLKKELTTAINNE